MTEPFELLVIQGQKQGARAPVSDSKLTSVGNDYDCDVMLGLPGIEHALALPNSENQKKLPVDFPKMEMKQHEGRLLVRVVRGNIKVGQETLSEGGQSELRPDTPVTLGDSVFVVGPTSALQTVENQIDVSGSQDVVTSDATNATTNAQPTEETEVDQVNAKPKNRAAAGLMYVVAGLCIVVGGAVAILNYGNASNATEPDASKVVAAELERGGFASLSVALLENDAVLVNGFLESRAELHEVRNLVQSSTDATIEEDIQLGEELVDSVQSVFQVNDVAATVESVSKGSVLVRTNSDDMGLLERIEKIAYDDVADLEHLELINTIPVVTAEEEVEPKNNSVDSLPGKRIVLIVAGEYIKTEDDSVYYQGSVLPSGHKVLAILDKKIQVVLDGNQTELTF